MRLVGNIVSTHGIKGEVKVLNESSFNRFVVGNILFVKKDNRFIKIKIDSVRKHKNFILITFNNIDNINDCLDYINKEIYTDAIDELEEGKYYYDDLIGSMVIDMKNEKIGVVKDIIEVPQGELLEILKNDNKVVTIPYVKAFIKEVDINTKMIKIDPIEGLL